MVSRARAADSLGRCATAVVAEFSSMKPSFFDAATKVHFSHLAVSRFFLSKVCSYGLAAEARRGPPLSAPRLTTASLAAA